MTNKTAMQEMLEWTRQTFPMDLDTPRMIEEKIESLLKVEKEQMIKFAQIVLNKAECSHTGMVYIEEDMEYIYNETYKQQNK